MISKIPLSNKIYQFEDRELRFHNQGSNIMQDQTESVSNFHFQYHIFLLVFVEARNSKDILKCWQVGLVKNIGATHS